MEKFGESNIRNVILGAHSGAGKTSLAEAILFSQGKTTRLGSVDSGTTVSDYDPIEISRKISINVSISHSIAQKNKINIIDTPGYADFVVELQNAIFAADSAIVVVSAQEGVEVGTQRVWDMLEKQEIPRAIFVSKLDKENADFYKILENIKNIFGKKCVPFTIPSTSPSGFKGIVSLLDQSNQEKILPELKEKVEKFRENFIELIAEVDDQLVEKYLNGEELTQEEIGKALKLAISEKKIFPIFSGNALTLIGIKELVDFICNYFPSPVERGEIEAHDPKTKEKKMVLPKAEGPFSGYVLKTIADPYVGQLSVFRVFSGQLSSNTEFYNVNQDTQERIGQLYVLQGKEQLPVDSVSAGDIAAVTKLKSTQTGDSLCSSKNLFLFDTKIRIDPAISYSLKPKTRQDEEKISQALAKLVNEDQGIKVLRDPQTKELIISGMGDLHLEINIERLKKRYNVDVEVGLPKVPYKETVTKKSQVQGKYKRQSGGRGQYGDVWLEIEPLERGKDFEFVDRIVGGAIPRQYVPSVEKGVRQAMSEGILSGFPLVNLRVSVYDGSYHNVDSSDMAFQIAGSMALRKGALEAHPVLLEPVMEVEIFVTDDSMGVITGDLNSRRGRVQGVEPAGKYQKIKALLPLAEILRYGTELRSMTQGRGSYIMKFSHYEEVPQRIAEKVIAQHKVEVKEKEE